MKKITITLYLLILTIYSSNAQTQTVTFKPNATIGEDASITNNGGNCSNWPNSPDPTSVDIFAIAGTMYNVNCTELFARSMFKFSALSTIPANATIVSAELKLFGVSSSIHYSSGNTSSNNCFISRITSPWTEAGVTWNTQPTTTTLNQISTSVSGSTWNWNFTNSSPNLVSMVQYMVSNPSQNYGFMFKLETESIYRAMIFASSDNPDSTLWPQLTVTYQMDTCNTNFDYKFTTLNPFQVYCSPSSPGNSSTYDWTINGSTFSGQSITHTFPGNGTNEICLNQILQSGEKCVSTCAKVCIGDGLGILDNNRENGFEVNVSPNPTNNHWLVNVIAPKNINANFVLIDAIGRQVSNITKSLKVGPNSTTIDAQNLAAGFYYLNIISENQKIIASQKVIKN